MRGDWPPWWAWELVFSNHALKRMVQRDFNEIDGRMMLDVADRVRWGSQPDRWIVSTSHRGIAWEVVIDRDEDAQCLIVVTACRLD